MNYREVNFSDWHEARQKGIGGSDVAAIAGMSNYGSPLSVYLEKIGEAPEKEDNPAMFHGRLFEKTVVEMFEKETGKKTREQGKVILQHPTIDFIIGNVDRFIEGEEAILECKTTSGNYCNKENIPASYELQCHHYMMVTGAQKCYLAVLVFQKDFFIKEIDRDEEVIEYLETIEKNFWNNFVLPKIMPAPDGSNSATDLLSRMFPRAQKRTVELQNCDEKLTRFKELNTVISELEKEREQIKQEVQLQMEDAEKATTGKHTVYWNNVNSNRFDTTTFKKTCPEIYNTFLKQSSYRKFMVKEAA
jgi:putative phage-type endonuclease